MSELRRCPQCDAEIPANSPAGLCPRCLLKASTDSQSAAASVDPGPTKLTPPSSGFVPPTVAELAPLFPQLEILELLGKGGMGAVYKARQPGLDRLVALKILPPEISHDPAFAERFQREARALAKLSHPHIVAVYDFGTTEANGGRQPPGAAGHELNQGADAPRSPSLCFIVMEFVDGANLRQTIRAGKLAAAEALAIVPQICEALQFAHDEGIVHRDIKPENILIDKRGRVKIADFGLAKLMANGGRESPGASLTATHQVMGTLRYMAPEQMQGSREVDHRADIYSLGVVFYELLTGELPMGRFAPPSKKVQVDVRLDEVVLRALEQDPEQRFQHASDVKSELDTISRTPLPASVVRPELSKGVESAVPPDLTPFADSGRATRLPAGEDSTIRVWWFSLSEGVRRILSMALNCTCVFCLFGFFSFHGQTVSDGNYRYEVGALDPWLVVERRIGAGQRFESSIVLAWSWLFGIGAYATGWLLIKLRGEKLPPQSGSQSTSAGRPLTQMRFTVTAATDVTRQAVFHFSSLGYQVIEQRPDTVVFQRGGQWAGLWETDIRKIATRLTVRTAPAAEGQSWVSCDWSVRTLGAWIARRDIRQFEAEGDGFKSLLGVAEPQDLPGVDALSRPRAFFGETTLWTVLVCLLGLVAVPLTWVSVNYPEEASVLGRGFHSTEGLVCGGMFLAALLCLVATGRDSPLPAWRPSVLFVAGVTVLSVAWHAVFWTQKVPTPVSWWMSYLIDGSKHTGFISTIELDIGFFLTAASAVSLLFVSAIEFRRVVRQRQMARPESAKGLAAEAKQPSRASLSGTDTIAERAWDSTDVLVRLVRSERPKLVPVLATMNLIGAILLMLSCAAEEPTEPAKPLPRLWQMWEQVDSFLGFSMAAGLFAASIGLFLWKPWARKLTLVVCCYGLASVVFDAPYIARVGLPELHDEIRKSVIAEGVPADAQDFVTLFTVAVLMGGVMLVGLTWLIGQLVYFTRPRVVAAFASPKDRPNRFVEWLFTRAGAVVGVLSVFGPLALLLGISQLMDRGNSTSSQVELPPPPSLGTIAGGIGAEFRVPAGQVAVLEIVTRRDGQTVPAPPHCGYVIAPSDRRLAATFRWVKAAEQPASSDDYERWNLEIKTAGGGGGFSGGLLLPKALSQAVGGLGIQMGDLVPNEEVIHWLGNANDLPENGLLGLRVTVTPHGLETSGGSGNAHVDWKKAQTATSTTKRKLSVDAP